MAPHKTKLARAKALADKHCAAYFQGRPCAVCGTTIGTVGHHIVTRSVGFLRHHGFNLIALCDKHHNSGDMAPHSTLMRARNRFTDFLTSQCPIRMEWLAKHRHDKTIPTAEDYLEMAEYWKGRNNGN